MAPAQNYSSEPELPEEGKKCHDNRLRRTESALVSYALNLITEGDRAYKLYNLLSAASTTSAPTPAQMSDRVAKARHRAGARSLLHPL